MYEFGHILVSVSGWTCDECGRPVNGQTNDQGWPMVDGDNVHHTPREGEE